MVVSIDGGSGAGKSKIATEVAMHLGATVIHCDDFFATTVHPKNGMTVHQRKSFCVVSTGSECILRYCCPLLEE